MLKPKGYYLAVFFLKDTMQDDTGGPPYKIEREVVEKYFKNDFDLLESYIPKTHYKSRPHGSEYLCFMQLR